MPTAPRSKPSCSRSARHRAARDARRHLVPAPRRARYNVVDYLEPMQGNEPAFGLNVSGNGEVARALARAHASGRAAATGLLNLAQAPGKPSFEVLMPVYGPVAACWATPPP
jgi:CHASE1-domain containing sensor protein